MCFLTISRHALLFGVLAWMTAAMCKILVGWCFFLSSIFESIEMTPPPEFMEKYIPKDFMGQCTVMLQSLVMLQKFGFRSL